MVSPQHFRNMASVYELAVLIPSNHIKHYFNVSNSYVIRKLCLALFPWLHRQSRRPRAHWQGNGFHRGTMLTVLIYENLVYSIIKFSPIDAYWVPLCTSDGSCHLYSLDCPTLVVNYILRTIGLVKKCIIETKMPSYRTHCTPSLSSANRLDVSSRAFVPLARAAAQPTIKEVDGTVFR